MRGIQQALMRDRGRRVLTAALYVGCLAATAGIVYPLVANSGPVTGPVTEPLRTHLDPDDPLLAVRVLPAGKWVPVDAGAASETDRRRRAREAAGVASAAQFDLSAFPLPPGAVTHAVRIDTLDRPCAVLTRDTSLPAASAWEAAGWRVVGDRNSMFHLTRGDHSAIVWVVRQGGAVRLLITLSPREGASTGGFDR